MSEPALHGYEMPPDDLERSDQPKSKGINSIHRALTMMEIMAHWQTPKGVSELARAMNLDPSTVHRVLATLVAAGWVHRNADTRKYSLSLKLAHLGATVRQHDILLEKALPSLKSLARGSGETVHLAVLDGGEVIFLAHEMGRHFLGVNVDLLSRGPSHCTAVGKAMLSGLTRHQVESRLAGVPLEQRTPHTITSLPELLDDLALVRQKGYALDAEEYELGVSCIAAPVFHQKRVLASVGITGPTMRVSGSRIPQLAAAVLASAKEIMDLLQSS